MRYWNFNEPARSLAFEPEHAAEIWQWAGRTRRHGVRIDIDLNGAAFEAAVNVALNGAETARWTVKRDLGGDVALLDHDAYDFEVFETMGECLDALASAIDTESGHAVRDHRIAGDMAALVGQAANVPVGLLAARGAAPPSW